MLLPVTEGLMPTSPFDRECALLADRHYSRRTVGSPQFANNGRKLILRNAEGSVLFVWLFPKPELRFDKQTGYNNSLFRNESERLSSDIILEAEQWALREVGTGSALHVYRPAQGSERKSWLLLQAGWLAACRVLKRRQTSTCEVLGEHMITWNLTLSGQQIALLKAYSARIEGKPQEYPLTRGRERELGIHPNTIPGMRTLQREGLVTHKIVHTKSGYMDSDRSGYFITERGRFILQMIETDFDKFLSAEKQLEAKKQQLRPRRIA